MIMWDQANKILDESYCNSYTVQSGSKTEYLTNKLATMRQELIEPT